MAEITRVGIPAVLSVLTLAANRINGSLAGEDIAAGDACYIDSDGKVHRSSGSTAGDAADVRGFATTEAESGRAVSLAFDVTMRYGEDLPEDRNLYLSGAVPGGLADSPSPGGTRPVAFVVDATRIHVLQS
jgi:hypothetical protein